MQHRLVTVAVVGIILGTTGCGGSETIDSSPLTKTYSSGSSPTAWPWNVDSLTVTCSDLAGSAHASVGGITYGLTGRDSTSARTRGYQDSSALLQNPSAYATAEPFLSQVVKDCKDGFRARGEKVY